jgi:CBS domain-containing protein
VRVGEACRRDVVIVDRNDSIQEAATLMREHHVGTVVVTQQPDGERMPIGIVTDRDITIELVAKNIDIGSVSVADVMSEDLVRLGPEEGIMEALQLMKDHGVRRAPVINENGGLIGILALDDIIELIAEQLLDVVNLLNRAHRKEERIRR